MVKIKNIYQDKATKKWYFRVYLGTDLDGKRIQKTKRGFSTQREAKLAFDKYMLAHGFSQSITNQIGFSGKQMTFEEFYRVRFVKWYEKQVKRQTVENAQFIFFLSFTDSRYYYKRY
ncbi:Arm DNA-binding domain-containing protein [Enterococcus olivae]